MPHTAVPFILKGIGASVAAIFGFAATEVAALAIGSAVIALAVVGIKRASDLRKSGGVDRRAGRSILLRSTDAPCNVVYGEQEVGGILVYGNSTGAELRQLYLVIAHCKHEVEAYTGWRIDDKFVPIADVDQVAFVNLTDGTYQWTASGSGTNEYYLEASGGGDPSITQPVEVFEDGAELTEGTAGSLAVSEWDWADNDTLGFSTVYVRLSDGADPDSKADGFVSCENGGLGDVDADTGSHGLGPVDATPVAYLRGHLGHAWQTADSMLNAGFVDIDSGNRGRGLAYSVCRFDWLVGAEEVYDGIAPTNVAARVKGKKCYDPRLDSTFSGDWGTGSGAHRVNDASTWAWTDNPALIWADYRIDSIVGPGWATSRIDYNSVAEAADDCEVSAAVPVASTEDRFVCNLAFSTNERHRDVIAKILATMFGREQYYNGQFHVYAGVWPATTTFALTADDLVGPVEWRKQPTSEQSERYNQVRGTYIDAARNYKTSQFITVDDSTLRTNRDNGRVLPVEIDLEGVTGEYQAQRIAIRHLNQADDTGILVFPMGYQGADIRVGDVGTVTLDELGFAAKTFRCVELRMVDLVGVELVLKEDASANYTDPTEGTYGTRSAAGVITFPTIRSANILDSGSLMGDPFFRRTTGVWDNNGFSTGDHLAYFWRSSYGSTPTTGDVSIVSNGGIIGGVAQIVSETGLSIAIVSVPRDSAVGVDGEKLKIQLRVRKTNNPTLTAGNLFAGVGVGDGDGVIDQFATGSTTIVNYTTVNGWTQDVWQDFELTFTLQNTANPPKPYVIGYCDVNSFTPELHIEVDLLNVVRVV